MQGLPFGCAQIGGALWTSGAARVSKGGPHDRRMTAANPKEEPMPDARPNAALRADPALGGGPVTLIDGEMTSWYGVRAIQGLAWLRAFRRTLDAECPT